MRLSAKLAFPFLDGRRSDFEAAYHMEDGVVGTWLALSWTVYLRQLPFLLSGTGSFGSVHKARVRCLSNAFLFCWQVLRVPEPRSRTPRARRSVSCPSQARDSFVKGSMRPSGLDVMCSCAGMEGPRDTSGLEERGGEPLVVKCRALSEVLRMWLCSTIDWTQVLTPLAFAKQLAQHDRSAMLNQSHPVSTGQGQRS